MDLKRQNRLKVGTDKPKLKVKMQPVSDDDVRKRLLARLTVVLKFLKFHSCPEIVLKSAIVLKFYSFGQNVSMDLCYAVTTLVYKS